MFIKIFYEKFKATWIPWIILQVFSFHTACSMSQATVFNVAMILCLHSSWLIRKRMCIDQSFHIAPAKKSRVRLGEYGGHFNSQCLLHQHIWSFSLADSHWNKPMLWASSEVGPCPDDINFVSLCVCVCVYIYIYIYIYTHTHNFP